MNKRLVLIHTVPPLVGVFTQLAAEKLPGVKLFHVLDEPLLEQVRQHGNLEKQDLAKLQSYIEGAEQIGANGVLVTCSTLSPGIDHIHARIPVFKIDEAMISQAVSAGSKIGVVATNQTTLEPTRQMLLARAAKVNKPIAIEMVLVEQALPALLSGDGTTHDRLVKQAVLALAPRVQVIVLAQASMARVLNVIAEEECAVPILSSPYTALERVRQELEK